MIKNKQQVYLEETQFLFQELCSEPVRMEVFLQMPLKQRNKTSQHKLPQNPQKQCRNRPKKYLNSPKRLMSPNQSRKKYNKRSPLQVFSEKKTKILCLGYHWIIFKRIFKQKEFFIFLNFGQIISLRWVMRKIKLLSFQ